MRNAGRPWADAFAFKDVTNYGQTTHRLAGLLPGVRYTIIVGSLNRRFGAAAWSEWAYLTTAAGARQCPAGPGEPPAPLTPGATATPVPSATPDPNATPGPGTTATPKPGATRIPTPTASPTVAPRPGATATPSPSPTPTSTPTPAPRPTPTPAAVSVDYDKDDDGLIEISSLAQLDAVRYDLDGDGVVSADADGYAAAFLNAAAGMGCFRNRCGGYELAANLDFDTNGSGDADAGDTYWDDRDGWERIGDIVSPFEAALEGNGRIIANLYVDRADTSGIGLFGATGEDGVIRNVRLTGVRVAGKNGVGGLAGSNGGSISGSRVAVAVAVAGSDIYVGGLAGFSTGAISGSHATGKATGVSFVGGLVGSSWGAISGSYATASAAAASSDPGDGGVGGLVGGGGINSITTSYAIGKVTGDRDVGGLVGRGSDRLQEVVTGSYWDTQTTGQSGSAGGAGKTTRELQQPTGAIGIYADWDEEYWDFGTS